MAYVIRRNKDLSYVAMPGEERSFTRVLYKARRWASRADAALEACGDEHVDFIGDSPDAGLGGPPSSTVLKSYVAPILDAVLRAAKEQRDDIPDSDLDDEQPISLHVRMTLGDIRRARRLGLGQ